MILQAITFAVPNQAIQPIAGNIINRPSTIFKNQNDGGEVRTVGRHAENDSSRSVVTILDSY